MVAISGGSWCVAADGAVGVALPTDARMQQVNAHQVLGVSDGLAAATQLALRGEFVGDTLGLHLAQSLRVRVLRGRVVEPARVGAGVSSALVCASVVAVAVARVYAGLIRGGRLVSVFDVLDDPWSGNIIEVSKIVGLATFAALLRVLSWLRYVACVRSQLAH